MKPEPTHNIRRLVLEVEEAREADAKELQKEISGLFHEKILTLLDKYLSEYSPGDAIHRLDRLELNLGTIDRANFAESLIRELSLQLEDYIQASQQTKSTLKTEKSDISAEKSSFQLFSYFIETGSLPWWVDPGAPDPVKESLNIVLGNNQPALLAIMHEWVHNPNTLRRIVSQTGFRGWSRLAALNMDCTDSELISLLTELMDLMKSISPWNEYSKHKLEETLGLQLLPWVYLSRRKKQNTSDFWRSFLIQLAEGQRIRYEDFIKELSREFEVLRKGQTELENQMSVLFTSSWKRLTPAGSFQARLFEQINKFLEVRGIPEEEKSVWFMYLRRLNEHVLEDKDLDAISERLDRAVADASANSRSDLQKVDETVKQDGPTLSVLWKKLTPHGSLQANLFEEIKYLLNSKTLSREKHAKWLADLHRINEQVMDEKDLKLILRRLVQAFENEQDLSDAVQLSDKRKMLDLSDESDQKEFPEPAEVETDGFSDIDELFVGNAGLVILWPFLTRFFEHLNLLEGRQFADDASKHRAVGLIQYLVDGEETPPEYLCGLNKILCGLDLETALVFGEPVTKEEAETCKSFLEAVIANAPILGEISVDGFRGSFLVRNGVIRAGAGIWQLNVERQTFDVVLERFPWKWTVVKLPWMKWAIEVEWL